MFKALLLIVAITAVPDLAQTPEHAVSSPGDAWCAVDAPSTPVVPSRAPNAPAPAPAAVQPPSTVVIPPVSGVEPPSRTVPVVRPRWRRIAHLRSDHPGDP